MGEFLTTKKLSIFGTKEFSKIAKRAGLFSYRPQNLQKFNIYLYTTTTTTTTLIQLPNNNNSPPSTTTPYNNSPTTSPQPLRCPNLPYLWSVNTNTLVKQNKTLNCFKLGGWGILNSILPMYFFGLLYAIGRIKKIFKNRE